MRVPQFDIGKITQVGGMGSPYQTARAATPDTFGAAAGQQTERQGVRLEQDSDKLMRVAIDIRQKDNEAEAREHDAAFMRAINVESHGGMLDPNDPATQKTGFFNTKNKDTSAALGDFNKAIQAHRDRIYGSASNDSVKRLLEKQFNTRVYSQFQASHRYAAQQKDNYRKIQAATRQAASINLGVSGTDNDFVTAYNQIADDEKALTKDMGLDPEVVKQSIANKRSELIISRISRLNASDEPGSQEKAKALFESQSALGNIDGEKYGGLKEAIDKASVDTEANQRFDSFNLVTPLSTATGDLDPKNVRLARDQAKKIQDTKIRTAFEKKIDKAIARITSVAKAEKNNIAGKVRTWLHQNPGKDIFDWRNEEPQNKQDFNRIAGDGYLFNSIVGTQTALQKNKQFSKVTDNKTYPEILGIPKTELAEITDPKSQLANWTKLTQQEQDRITKKIQTDKKEITALKQDARYLKKTWPKIANHMPKRMALAMKNESLPSSDANYEIVMEARETMRAWMLDDAQINNRPTDEQISRKAAEIMMDVQSDPEGFTYGLRSGVGSFDGYAVQRRNMSPQQRAVATVPYAEIPAHIKLAIERDLENRARTVDNDGRKQALFVETQRRMRGGEFMAVYEELAGALAMGDSQRIRRILGQ